MPPLRKSPQFLLGPPRMVILTETRGGPEVLLPHPAHLQSPKHNFSRSSVSARLALTACMALHRAVLLLTRLEVTRTRSFPCPVPTAGSQGTSWVSLARSYRQAAPAPHLHRSVRCGLPVPGGAGVGIAFHSGNAGLRGSSLHPAPAQGGLESTAPSTRAVGRAQPGRAAASPASPQPPAPRFLAGAELALCSPT